MRVDNLTPLDLYMGNEKLVYFVMNRKFPRLCKDEDFLQVARIGLWKACRTYRPELNKFSTYASKCIYTEVCYELRRLNAMKYTAFETISLQDLVCGDTAVEDSIACEDPMPSVDIHEFFNSLSEEEKIILSCSLRGVTQCSIAERLGITQCKVSRMYKKIRLKFKDFM